MNQQNDALYFSASQIKVKKKKDWQDWSSITKTSESLNVFSLQSVLLRFKTSCWKPGCKYYYKYLQDYIKEAKLRFDNFLVGKQHPMLFY